MKSLEIVNKIQNDFNECFSRYDVSTMTIQNPNFYAKEWEQIKQDLEVLEIIRKYIPKNWSGFQIIISDKKTKYEDWKKLKQWLEENENV